MTRKFFNRILREQIVDTRKYRYTYDIKYRTSVRENGKIVHEALYVIRRIPLDYLDISLALGDGNWEKVWECVLESEVKSLAKKK